MRLHLAFAVSSSSLDFDEDKRSLILKELIFLEAGAWLETGINGELGEDILDEDEDDEDDWLASDECDFELEEDDAGENDGPSLLVDDWLDWVVAAVMVVVVSQDIPRNWLTNFSIRRVYFNASMMRILCSL